RDEDVANSRPRLSTLRSTGRVAGKFGSTRSTRGRAHPERRGLSHARDVASRSTGRGSCMTKPQLQFWLIGRVPTCGDRWGDRPRVQTVRRPLWPRRWSRQLRLAVPAALAVFRQLAVKPASEGTPVMSSTGRPLGTVRTVVVEIDS